MTSVKGLLVWACFGVTQGYAVGVGGCAGEIFSPAFVEPQLRSSGNLVERLHRLLPQYVEQIEAVSVGLVDVWQPNFQGVLPIESSLRDRRWDDVLILDARMGFFGVL